MSDAPGPKRGFQSSAMDLRMAPSPHSACCAHCQCHGHPLSPTRRARAAPALHSPAPHNQRQHQAGLETYACSGKERGRENFGGSEVCMAPGHVHYGCTSLPPPWTAQCPTRLLKTPQERALQARVGPEPTSTRYEPGSGGARSARQREGDWAEAPRRQRTEADAPSRCTLPSSTPARLWPGATCGEPSCDMHTQAGAGSGLLSRSRGLKQHASRLWAAMTIMRQILSSCKQPSA